MSKIWFITGCSTGFGRELAKEVLLRGFKVAVTSRDTKDIEDIVADYPENAVAIALDVTNEKQIADAVKTATEKFGAIDVLVNNAGIGYFSSIEESDEKEIRQMFEINFFGLAKTTTEVLPIMRKQKSGMIINIASIGGLVSFPAVGYYNATKYAVDGFSEALSKELDPLGIKVMVVAPSGFRTDWAGRSANESESTIPDYAETAKKNKESIRGSSGSQAGDPVRAAKAIVDAVESGKAPLRLLLGKAALKGARNKLETLKKDYDEWEQTTIDADFPSK